MILLSPVEMGDNLNLEAEYTYLCSGGSKLTTIDIRPALKEQASNIYKWGNETCFEHGHGVYKRHNCFKCWQQLKKEIEAR